ncbi:MAG: reprolysin-like metallopeptidase, partial [Bacteroidota bacterium]
MKSFLFLAIFAFVFNYSHAQENFFKSVDRQAVIIDHEEEMPSNYEVYEVDLERMKYSVLDAPLEYQNQRSNKLVALPIGNGKFETFEVFEAPFLPKNLSIKYPNIKSYKGINKNGIIHFDISPNGFNSLYKGVHGVWYNDVLKGKNILYNAKDVEKSSEGHCGVEDHDFEITDQFMNSPYSSNHRVAKSLKTYRTAVATTGEYTRIRAGGSKTVAISNINTAFNRLNLIFQTELGIKFELIEGNDTLIYLNEDLDPYPVTNG